MEKMTYQDGMQLPFEISSMPSVGKLLEKGKWWGLAASALTFLILLIVDNEQPVKNIALIILIGLLVAFVSGPLFLLGENQMWQVQAEGISYWQGEGYLPILLGAINPEYKQSQIGFIPFDKIRRVDEQATQELVHPDSILMMFGGSIAAYQKGKKSRPWGISLRVIDMEKQLDLAFTNVFHAGNQVWQAERQAFEYITENTPHAIHNFQKAATSKIWWRVKQ